MSKRKYSSIWLHFDDEGQKAKCKYCQTILSSSGGSHGNLKRHLKAKHPMKALDLEGEVVSSVEIMKFEEPVDEESSSSSQIRTITQDYELSEFITIPSTIHKVEQNNMENKNLNTQKKKYSAIWLHFDDEDDKRATCKYCKTKLCYSGGSHGNLKRHLKSKHPLKILNAEFKESNFEEAQHFEMIDEQPPVTNHVRKIRQHHIMKLPNRNKIKQKYFKPMSKRKHSVSWLHFEDIGSKRAMCKHCQKTISFSGGCHGNLRRHLKLKHPLMPLIVERKIPHQREMLDLQEAIDEQPPINTDRSTTSQKRNKETESFKEQIDQQVLKMIAKGNHSFWLLEEPEFKKLINDVSNCPGYTLPSKEILSVSLLPNIHRKLLEDIKRKLSSATAVCLATDGWTSITDSSCFTVTAHYINSDTVLTSHLLACEEFENTHTPEDLWSFINNIISEFEINKVTAIVSTNEQNIGAAIRQGDWRGITCFAHSLLLILKSATTEIVDTINKVRRIADCFNKSFNTLKGLHIADNQMNISQLKLMQNDSRWSSTFEMLQEINKIKDEIITTLSINRPDLMLAADDWEIIAEALKILKPFHEVIVEISGEKCVPLSKVTILCNLLERHIAKCLPSSEEVTEMVINLQIGIASQFGNLENVDLYAESTLLDPRFKRKGFKTDVSYEQALESLKSKICTIKLQIGENDTYDPLNTIVEESLWETYDSEFNETLKQDDTVAGIRELDKYMNEEYLDRRKDPLLWWNERKHLYPRLYKYVLKRLCVVATSLPCERIFTTTGQILSERRTLLRSNETEGLVFLHNNM